MATAPLTAREVDLDHVGRLDQRLDHAAGRDQHAVAPETHGEVTVAAGDQPALGELIAGRDGRSEEHTSELQSHLNLVCRLLLEKKNQPDLPRNTAIP